MNAERKILGLPNGRPPAYVLAWDAPPLTAELWARLKRLDGRYCISTWRDGQWLVPGPRNTMIWSGIGGAPAPHRRVWRVRIFPKGCAIHEILDAHAQPLGKAVLAAVEEAERRGWHQKHYTNGAWL